MREKSAGLLFLARGEKRESCSRIFITGDEERNDKSKNSSPGMNRGLLVGVRSVFVDDAEGEVEG